MRVITVVALALLGTMSGCLSALGVGPQPEPAPEAADAWSTPFVIEDCDYAEMILRVPRPLLAPHVPPDFELTTEPTSVYLGVADCTLGAAGDDSGPVAFLWTDVDVEPVDARLRVGGVNQYLYRVENVVLDDAYGRVSAALQTDRLVVDTIGVTIEFSAARFDATGAGFHHEAQAPLGEMLKTGSSPLPFREYGAATGGYAYIEGELTSGAKTDTRPGLMVPSEGSVAREVLGPAAPGLLYFGRDFTFGESRVGWLPWPPE